MWQIAGDVKRPASARRDLRSNWEGAILKQHIYTVGVEWTGNTGEGTRTYRGYKRDHVICSGGKPELPGSSDTNFCGDPARYNPEELLVASLSACHMLWYLHLCVVHHIVVCEYRDAPAGWMQEHQDGGGEFVRVELRPAVRIDAGSDAAQARKLHTEAHHLCFIARSVNFAVDVQAEISL
jgi:organic hydroperoxide reductase OsmC/OhrA